jgi:hypothetical protein
MDKAPAFALVLALVSVAFALVSVAFALLALVGS